MSIVFDLAEAINLLFGVILGEATPSIINKLKDRATQKEIKNKLLLVIGNNRNLPDKVKEDLTILIKDPQFLTIFLKPAVEINAGSSDNKPSPRKVLVRTDIEQRWEAITSRLNETIKTKVQENFRTAIIEEVIKTLSPADQHMHYMLSYLQIRMDQLQQTVQQNVTQQAAIDELRSMIDDIHEGIAGRRLGSLSVDDRVNQYFSLCDSLIPAVFMGRENEIDQINNFILEDTENCDQWWWWQADAWAGKTALMAHLASNPEPGVNLASVFIIGREPANADSDAFYSYLIPQLAKIAGLTWVEIPSDLQGRIAQLEYLIDAAAARSRPNNGRLVILVDGLDEDRGPYRETTKQSIAASLPNSLPTNVRVIVSSRHNPPLPIDVPDSHPLQDPRYRHPLEISEYAKAAWKAATVELKRIIKITDGSNRYGRDVLAFIAASGSWLTARDLAKLTKQDIYSIEEILKENATARSFRINHLLDGNLAYAIGHDLLDQLLVCEYLEETISPPMDKGNAKEINEDRERYEKDRYHVLKQWRNKIADWAEEHNELDWPSSTPDYLCSEAFADLLSRDPDLEKQALSILTDQSRINLLQSKHGNDYQSITQLQFFIDKLAARITCIPSDSLTHLAAALHFLDLLSGRTLNIPPELPAVFALLGRSEYAETLAFSIIEPSLRIKALVKLVTSLIQCGSIDKVTKISKFVLSSISNEILFYTYYREFSGLVTALAQSFNAEEVINFVKTITDTYIIDFTISRFIILFSQEGKTDEATKLANTISDPEKKAKVLINIVTARTKCGRTEMDNNIAHFALTTINYITDFYKKANVLTSIAITFAESNKTDDAANIAKLALTTANAISDIDEKNKALAKVATAFVNTGLIDEVLEFTKAITEPYNKAQALIDVANKLAKCGKTKMGTNIAHFALTTANNITDLYKKANVLTSIAITFAESNKTDDAANIAKLALTTANAIPDIDEKNKALVKFATAFVNTGLIDEVLEFTKAITEPYNKAQAFIDVANKLVKCGKTEMGYVVAHFALTTANNITDFYKKANVLTSIAITFAESNKTDDAANIAKLALTTANAISDIDEKNKALAKFATAFVNTGLIDEVLEFTKAITEPYNKAQALIDVANKLAKCGKSEMGYVVAHFALSTANNITDLYKKANILTSIAASFLQVGYTSEAFKVAQLAISTILDSPLIGEIDLDLACVAYPLAYSGRTNKALKIANAISYPSDKAGALACISIAQALKSNITKASKIAELALSTANAIKNSGDEMSYVKVATAFAHSGETNKALMIANSINNPTKKALAIANIAVAFMESGDTTRAFEIANAITEPDSRTCRPLTHIAKELATRGNTAEAIKIANNITESNEKVLTLANIAFALAESKKTDESLDIAKLALSTAYSIASKYYKAISLTTVAITFSNSGYSVDANKTAEIALKISNAISEPNYKSEALSNVVFAFSKLGKIDEATKIANDITEPDDKAIAFADVAVALAKSGRTDAANQIAELALSTADAIPIYFGSPRPRIFGELAIIFSKSRLEKLRAKATVKMLLAEKNPWRQYDVLLEVSEPTAIAILPLLIEETEE